MTGCISFVLIAIASTVAMMELKMIPAEPISVTLDAYGNPIMFLREKRTAIPPYPHRTMMFTGYYRPIRRTSNSGQATGIFAQGNAVSGEAFFSGMHTPHLKGGPEPIEESEVSNAEAQAAPAFEEEQEHEYHRNEVHRHEEEQHHKHRHHDEEDYHYHRHHPDSLIPQGHHESEQIPLTTEIAQTTEKPITTTEVPVTRPRTHHTKKTHKTPVYINTDDDDDDNDEVDEEDDKPVVPFVPFKGNRRHQDYPHLNNFFPMIFSFPKLAGRAGSSGSFPGAITAIANSYSTGKGGVASSVATAYGGSQTGKKRRPQSYKE